MTCFHPFNLIVLQPEAIDIEIDCVMVIKEKFRQEKHDARRKKDL